MSEKKSPKPKAWYSEEHETALHPTTTVHEREKPILYRADGEEIVIRRALGFRK